MYYRANEELARILVANGLTETSVEVANIASVREFKLKPKGKRFIRFQDGQISDNVAEVNISQLDEIQLKTLLSLHLMHPISRKEMLRQCGPDLTAIQNFIPSLEYGVCVGETCNKFSINVMDTIAAIDIEAPKELVVSY
ncbi:MAG: hypothetical protein AB8H47_20140 [Bacteroidia bacterium]